MTTTTSPRRLKIQLSVDHSQLKSAELEKLLTLPADERWDVGQSYRPSPRSPEQRYRFSRWALCVTANSLDELEDAIQALTKRILDIEQKFSLLPSNSTVGLTLCVDESNTIIGIGFDPELIKLLARINAYIDVSLAIKIPR